MKEKILEKLQGLQEDDLAAMEFAAGRSEEMMKAYCNRKELPEELLGVGVSLAGMLLKKDGLKNIREGDVSVTFAEEKRDEQAMLKCFRTELDRYRKMDW